MQMLAEALPDSIAPSLIVGSRRLQDQDQDEDPDADASTTPF